MKKQIFLIIFILVFYFLTKLILTSLPEESASWLESIFVSCLYVMIGIFILIGGDSLKNYNIDPLSLILFILFGTIFRFDIITGNSLDTLFKIGAWGICVLIVIWIIRGKIPLARPAWRSATWVSIGLVSGILLAISLAYLIVHQPGFHMEPVDISQYTSLDFIVRTIANQGSYAAIPEEFIFRGLLVGYLVKLFENDNKAYLIQGLVFWLFHFDRILISPIAFFVTIPMGALLFSLLAWRSRSLTPSVAAHATYNTFYLIFAILMSSR
jgi:membrane protease YdiL (CAAX protease family)